MDVTERDAYSRHQKRGEGQSQFLTQPWPAKIHPGMFIDTGLGLALQGRVKLVSVLSSAHVLCHVRHTWEHASNAILDGSSLR